MTADEVRYRLMQRLSREPAATQRELAEEMGVSVGKINYCLRALIEKGHIKLDNFRRNPDKKHYTYLLTPAGIEAKAWATVQFLRRKRAEYEAIRSEIDALQRELVALGIESPDPSVADSPPAAPPDTRC
jgi:EPS-associated MarR family transcriptional regulator